MDTSDANTQKAIDTFDAGLDRRLAAALEACLHCGRCADACIFHLASGDASLIPGKRLQALSKAYFSRKTLPGRLLSLFGLGRPGRINPDALREAAYEACSMCGRCETFCPAGINAGEVMFLARTMLSAAGEIPADLKRTLDLALSSGNSMGITREDFLETIECLS